MFSRTARKIKDYILVNREKIENAHIKIIFSEQSVMECFKIDDEFIRKNQLQKIIYKPNTSLVFGNVYAVHENPDPLYSNSN